MRYRTNVLQGLGATETSGGACVSLPSDFNTFDHCGCPIKAMEAKLVSVPEMGYLVTDKVHGRIVELMELCPILVCLVMVVASVASVA